MAKDIESLDREDKERIFSKIEYDLIQDPDQGKKLKGKFKGLLSIG